MLEKYSLKVPRCVYSGRDSLDNITDIIEKEKPSTVAIFTDKGIERTGLIETVLKRLSCHYVIFDEIPAEPDYHVVEKLEKAFAASSSDFIIALGGGSVMDTAKLVSVLSKADYTICDLLRTPFIAQKQVRTLMIPTTAGTGSEATCNAIVLVPEDNIKVGIVNDGMIADYVILDPSTIINLPEKIAASTGLDALCHAIECFTGTKANPFSDTFALKALELIIPSIENAVKNKDAIKEKENMLIAAFYAGVAITSSGTTAVHALSYPLGGRYHIAHGVSNAMLLVPVMKFNRISCIAKLALIHDTVFGRSGKNAEEKSEIVINWLEGIVCSLGIPRLSEFGITVRDIPSLASAGLDVKRLMVNNPRKMSLEEAIEIYKEAL